MGKSPLEGRFFPGDSPTLDFCFGKTFGLRDTRHDAAVRGQSDSTFAMSQAN